MTPDDNMELVEIMARAMCAADGFVWEKQFSPMTNANGADSPESYLDAARAALTAIEASGRRIVPVEPTPAISRLSVGMSTTHEMARITFSPPLPR